ncbi:MAG: aldehyde dehydrogenase family protein, partial [Deltaproteobacteria bacterium]|nr:aldehyde dehydrogenase family protein [Deltaproteobacteria bacterium]
VVGIIAPINFPFCFALDDAIPALIAGNAVIVKPSEKNPQSALQAKTLLAECGLPADLYQVVVGEADLGEALVKSSGVDMICFTGSTETGKKVALSCAERLIPCHLELSGKAPAIVFADAPLKRAARGIVWSSFFHSGQDCVSTERVYVHESIHDAFVELAVREAKMLKFERDLGPLLSERQLDITAEQVTEAVAQGAKIACGGAVAGRYYLPTILTNVSQDMNVTRRETFGPLLPIVKFRDVDEVIRFANDSPYGLQATVWTRDRKLVERCCREIQAGNILVNDGLINFTMVETPFGGIKQSGIGVRHSKEGLKRFTYDLTVVEDRFCGPTELYWFPYTPWKGKLLKKLRSFFFHPWVRRWL